MITFARQIIKVTAVRAGIPEANIIDVSPDNITLPKPRLDIQFLPEVFTKTGRTLAINRMVNIEDMGSEGAPYVQQKILSVYEVRLGAACNIYTSSTEELEKITSAFIKALPRKFADVDNNIVKLWIASGDWKTVGGAQVGLTKIEPIKTRSRLVRIDFIYHVTEDKRTPYLTKFTIRKV